VRATLAVITGLIAWAVLATVLNFVLRIGMGGYLDAELLMKFSLPMMIGRLGVGAFASIGAGIACSKVLGAAANMPRQRNWALVTGMLLVLGFIPVHIYMWAAFPLWYHAFFLATLVPFVWLGATLFQPATVS
jgi:F0F1-type ATP synthase membrane subunit c/vacuolar-type H+-ATPase subunit K